MRKITSVSWVLHTSLKHIHTSPTENHSEYMQSYWILVRKLSHKSKFSFTHVLFFTHYLLFIFKRETRKFKLRLNCMSLPCVQCWSMNGHAWGSRSYNLLQNFKIKAGLLVMSGRRLAMFDFLTNKEFLCESLRLPITRTDARCEIKKFVASVALE